MNAAIPTAIALLAYVVGYRAYGGFLARRVFRLRPDVATPAHRLADGVDYVPTKRGVLFGHHYASIAGLSPMLGPAVAVIWGWLPALLWVVFGSLLIGAVHDFAALVVSVRSDGRSIGAVAEGIIGRRAKTLFHLIIFFLVALAMGVFVYVIAFLFSPPPTEAQAHIHFPQATIPSFGLMAVAAVIGWLGYRRGVSWKVLTPVGFALTLALVLVSADGELAASVGLGGTVGTDGLSTWIVAWSAILLTYAFAASVLPVWTLLQPRDFLNSLLLYLGLTGLYVGLFIAAPEFQAPAVRLHPEGAPPLAPFVFIIIACGAASGFHGLVSSGTTAKQLDRETDAQAVGYGGMIGESLLALIAVMATTAGFLSEEEWHAAYANWQAVQGLGPQVGSFINGAARFLEALGLPHGGAASFISVIVVSYALTSLDSATRLLRYNIEEMAEGFGLRWLKNRYLASAAAVAAIAFFAFYRIDGRPAGLALWALFGTTNQLLAGLTLLAVTLYLYRRRWAWWVTGLPMVGLLAATLMAMVENIAEFAGRGEWPLTVIGVFLLVLAVWLAVEAALALRRFRRDGRIVSDPEVHLGDAL
jgi:carbon starvation protein